jgi:hypothetical protein
MKAIKVILITTSIALAKSPTLYCHNLHKNTPLIFSYPLTPLRFLSISSPYFHHAKVAYCGVYK